MKKRLLSLALCLVLVVGLFSGLTVNASAGKIDDTKSTILKRLTLKKNLSKSKMSSRSRISTRRPFSTAL